MSEMRVAEMSEMRAAEMSEMRVAEMRLNCAEGNPRQSVNALQ